MAVTAPSSSPNAVRPPPRQALRTRVVTVVAGGVSGLVAGGILGRLGDAAAGR